jgi:hypothetical protein
LGRGDNHRSGFHSYESGPHSSGSRLQLMIDTIVVVFFGTTISCITLPSTPVMGVESGSTAFSRALKVVVNANDNAAPYSNVHARSEYCRDRRVTVGFWR